MWVPLSRLVPSALAIISVFVACASQPDTTQCTVDDATALVQKRIASVREAASSLHNQTIDGYEILRGLGREPFESGTIGDISPRILTDEAIEALRHEREQDDEKPASDDSSMNEATAETLAAAVGVALNRITARLDIHISRVIHAKEKLLQAVAQVGEGTEKLAAFEAVTNDVLDVAQQGSTTVAVVLRSTVSSTEASLETAGLRALAGTMEEMLGNALSRFDLSSQPAFSRAHDELGGLSEDTDEAAPAQRLTGLKEALRAYRRQANGLGHAMYKQFQDIVATVGTLAESSGLPPVAVVRLKTAFHVVEESAAAIAWKLYLPAWEIGTGVGTAIAELGIHPDEPAEESADEPLGGEIATLETSPSKPPAAQPVTRELDRVEQQVDRLLSKTMDACGDLRRALKGNEPQSFEAVVGSTLAAVESDWRAVGQALERTAKSITRCLATAGQQDVSLKLNSMFGDALQRSHILAHVFDEPETFSASLETFLMQQDILAQSFFRTYHEFMTDIGRTSTGVGSYTLLRRWQETVPLRAGGNRTAHRGDQAVDQICAAIKPAGRPMGQRGVQDGHYLRLDATEQDEDDELARRMFRRVQEVAFGSVQQASAISWKIHSAAWVLVSGIRKATVALIG